jgi:dihydrolipoamide dehydrogenase
MKYDLIIIGSGPGGYVAGIRASQLNLKVAIIEKADLGGVCLNWGCIPTKALLKSAQVFQYAKHASQYGINVGGEVTPDFSAIVNRSRNIASQMSKGVEFLMKKNKIDLISGFGKVFPNRQVEVTQADGNKTLYEAEHVLLATGARSRELPHILQDGKKIIGYREALTLDHLPTSMVVMGSGAIGSEFAYFYASMGTKVTLVEFLPNVVPVEDEEISRQLERSFRKLGVKVMTSSSVEKVEVKDDVCYVTVKDGKGKEIEIETEIVLSAVGVIPNLEGIGIEECNITIEKNKIVVDEFYRTSSDGVYAIGDIVHGPALAHVASREAVICVEKIAGLDVLPMDYANIPGCTYTSPEVASVGMTEKAALAQGKEILVGKFPFMASGKATASGNRDGMVKVIFDKETDLLLGCHLIGENVTEMISGAVVARTKGVTGKEILHSVHPHPTLSEAIMEATANAYGEAIHL